MRMEIWICLIEIPLFQNVHKFQKMKTCNLTLDLTKMNPDVMEKIF